MGKKLAARPAATGDKRKGTHCLSVRCGRNTPGAHYASTFPTQTENYLCGKHHALGPLDAAQEAEELKTPQGQQANHANTENIC